jgi:glycosyltransferase involved in cell wall biosynthesis
MNTPRILIITYYWPPSGGSPVLRWFKFSKHLPNLGIEPIVYTVSNGEYPSYDHTLAQQVDPNLTVLREPIWEPYTWYKQFLGLKKEAKIQTGFLSEQSKSSFRENFSIWIRGNFFIPDARKFWIKPSIKFLSQYLEEHPIDLIVTNGPPHSVHLIGLGLKKKYNLPWIADFRDPWTNIDFYHKLKLTRWADARHHWLEKQVLEHADLVTTVSWNWAEDLRKLGAKRVEVVTNAFDAEDYPSEKPALSPFFSFTHIGSLNKDRNPYAFWKVLGERCATDSTFKALLRVRMIGATDREVIEQAKQQGLADNLEIVGQMEHHLVLLELFKAPILLLPLNDTPNVMGIVPGKLYEYLASARPILAFGPLNGDTARILNETGAGDILAFNDETGIAAAVNRLYEQHKKGAIPPVQGAIDTYSRANQAKKMAGYALELIKESKS